MECLRPRYLPKREMYVPCGKCVFCGATRRADWSVRLEYEMRMHLESSFVTLTYSNNNLTFYDGKASLVRDDLQRFFKRLRKAGESFRYFAVGEYGGKTGRPHYHVLFFGKVDEVAIGKAWAKCNRRTGQYYPIGSIHVGTVTAASISYCLGYMVNGRKRRYKEKCESGFALMSRGDRKEGSKFRYGLGHNYLSKAMVDWHRSGRYNYVLMDGVKRHLPRYYKDRIFSAIDKVRIAVQCGKESFNRMLRFIRSKRGMKLRDPLAAWEDSRRRVACTMYGKSKHNLII